MIVINSNKRLNIFIDESGDFGFQEKSSQLYCVSFVLHESDNDINNDIEYLNRRLEKIGYNGMIHLGDLVANRKEYADYTFEDRKNIFWALFGFSSKTNIKIHTILINKNFKNKKTQLQKELKYRISDFFEEISEYIENFNNVVIYYDNGQKRLGNIIDELICNKSHIEHRVEFDHKEERLFQVADMMTYIDKIIYKFNKKIKRNVAERYFFELKDIIDIEKRLKNKRLFK